MVILVFARGCFGPRPCVIGTSRDPVWEFSLIMHSVVSLAYIPHIVRLVLFELCRCTMVHTHDAIKSAGWIATLENNLGDHGSRVLVFYLL